jgi:hypothetical protein
MMIVVVVVVATLSLVCVECLMRVYLCLKELSHTQTGRKYFRLSDCCCGVSLVFVKKEA